MYGHLPIMYHDLRLFRAPVTNPPPAPLEAGPEKRSDSRRSFLLFRRIKQLGDFETSDRSREG